MAKRKQTSNAVLGTVFGLYCGVMLWLLFDRTSSRIEGLSYAENLRLNRNLIPFFTIGNYWKVIVHRTNDDVLVHCVINLLGNILLFVPAGYLMPRLWKKQRNFFRFFFTCVAAILAVELLQLVTLLGSFDVDDIILNVFGMLLGYILYLIISKPSAGK